MRSVPERHALVTFTALIGAFVAGPFAGGVLGERLAPDSQLVQMLSVWAFALAFVGGLILWMGLGVIAVVFGAIRNLVRGRIPTAAADLDTDETLVPPGYRAFVVLSIAFPTAAGFAAGLASESSVLGVTALYALCGGVYGAGLWWLAHHGYLPFPEPQ